MSDAEKIQTYTKLRDDIRRLRKRHSLDLSQTAGALQCRVATLNLVEHFDTLNGWVEITTLLRMQANVRRLLSDPPQPPEPHPDVLNLRRAEAAPPRGLNPTDPFGFKREQDKIRTAMWDFTSKPTLAESGRWIDEILV